jgi:hypothetical protein
MTRVYLLFAMWLFTKLISKMENLAIIGLFTMKL